MGGALPAVTPDGTLLLHRFTVRPRHLDAFLAAWPDEVALRRRHGFTVHRAFVETIAEPKFTWLYSHPTPASAEEALRADPLAADLAARVRPHVFGNTVVRPVRPEWLTEATSESVTGRIAIMRRYSIVGDWAEFLAVWRAIVPVRERHGFRCLFAVADEPKDLFTWAFDFAGSWAEFAEAQRPYYADPERVALRRVFDYMADYTIAPATQLLVP
ncbi:MAG: hypothetical protein HZY73_14705 [Micropruina sp.]|nr:MAG: hypothetical protein HZY73_14705 [Micropruina sp.]